MDLSYVFSPALEKKQPGTSPFLRWYATHSQHLPRLEQGYEQAQTALLSQAIV